MADSLPVGVLFSERTDLFSSLIELAESDPTIAVVAAVTDRHHPMFTAPSGVPVREYPVAAYPERVDRDIAIAEWFRSYEVGLVVTASWLWLLSAEFLARFPNRVVNVHPTLLPLFPGRHSVEAAVAYGLQMHGVTVHLVDAGIDTGPILAQAALNFPEPTTATAVRAALAPLERRELGQVVQAIAHGRVKYDDLTARWKVAKVGTA